MATDELAIKRALLALEGNTAWTVLRDALIDDRERLRRQLEHLPLDATMEQVRYLCGQMRGLSAVIEKPQRAHVVERDAEGRFVRVIEEVR